MLQLSMDGPNVNWDVLCHQDQYRKEKGFPDIIIIGSCVLHILHGALKTGVKSTNWELDKILKAMWRLLCDSPTRRNIYIKETMCGLSHSVEPDGLKMDQLLKEQSRYGQILLLLSNIGNLYVRAKGHRTTNLLILWYTTTTSLIVVKLRFFKYIASILNLITRCYRFFVVPLRRS